MLDFQAARWLMAGEVAKQAGNNHPTSIPTGVFRTADGHMNIAAAGQRIWERFARTLGAPQWLEDPRFASGAARSDHRDLLHQEIETYTVRQPTAAWVTRLNEAGVPCGPINGIDQVFADPQVQHLGMARPLGGGADGDVSYVGQPMALSRTPSEVVTHPPALGADTDAVLGELGLTADAIAELRARRVV